MTMKINKPAAMVCLLCALCLVIGYVGGIQVERRMHPPNKQVETICQDLHKTYPQNTFYPKECKEYYEVI